MAESRLQIPKNPDMAKSVLDHDLASKQAELGALGKIFGSGPATPMYVCWSIVIPLLGFAIVWSFCCSKDKDKEAALSPAEVWKMVLPIVTLALGYIFGQKRDS